MNKFLFLFSVLIAYSSNAQIEKLHRKLKVTTCTISKKYYPARFKDSVEYQKVCNSSEVAVFDYDKKGRTKSKHFESKYYIKLNGGKDTFLISTEIATYNRKGEILTEDSKSQMVIYLSKDSIYNFLEYHYYKYDFFNRLKEENFGSNIFFHSYPKNRISYHYSFWGKLKLKMRFDKNEKLHVVDEYFYKKGELERSERWLPNTEKPKVYIRERNPINVKKVFLNDTLNRSSTSLYTYDFEKRLVSKVITRIDDKDYTLYFYDENSKKTVFQNDNFTNPRIEEIKFDGQKRMKVKYTAGTNSYYHYNSDGLLERIDFYINDELESYYPNYSLVYEYRCR